MTSTEFPMTRTLRIEGVAMALSSISHGEGRIGTVSLLRREKIAQPGGTVADVPVVSGNALRGILRDYAARVFWRALGEPPLPAPVFDLLWSGGSLTKTKSSLTARQLVQLRRVVPHVSLFGGSGAGRIVEGKLTVLKLTPIVVETVHVLPDFVGDSADFADDGTGYTPPHARDLLQVEEFSRRDDAKRDQLAPAIAELAPAALPTGQQGQLLPIDLDDPAPAAPAGGGLDRVQQMRYGVETLAAGTRLHWGIRLREVTDAETALFAAAMDAWMSDGAHIGGRSATGHGRLRLDCRQWQQSTGSTTVGDALTVPGDGDALAEHVTAHTDEITEALGWFAA